MDKVFHPDHSVPHRVKPVANADDEEEEEEEDGAEDDHAHAEMSTLKHSVLTTAIIISGFIIAYLVDDLRLGKPSACVRPGAELMHLFTVLSFVGSTGSTTISFILPGLFYWKLTRNDPSVRTTNLLSICLAVYGIFIFIFW